MNVTCVFIFLSCGRIGLFCSSTKKQAKRQKELSNQKPKKANVFLIITSLTKKGGLDERSKFTQTTFITEEEEDLTDRESKRSVIR